MVLPEGGVTHEFDTARFTRATTKEYFRDNVFSWYKFAKETNQGIKNGSLFIVTTTVHAPVWGMAVSQPADSAAGKKKQKDTLVYHQSGDNEHHYIWDSPHSSPLHCAGPTYEELKAVPQPVNRCLGIAPFAVWMDDATWTAHFGGNIAPSPGHTASPGPSHLDISAPSSSSKKISMKSLTSFLSSKNSGEQEPIVFLSYASETNHPRLKAPRPQ